MHSQFLSRHRTGSNSSLRASDVVLDCIAGEENPFDLCSIKVARCRLKCTRADAPDAGTTMKLQVACLILTLSAIGLILEPVGQGNSASAAPAGDQAAILVG